MLGVVPVPQYISDVLFLPGHDIRYIRMEKVILEYLELVFDKYQVSDKNYICVTRNADIAPDDELMADNEDFRFVMQETLHKRRRMAVVRLEAANPLGKEMEKYFCEKFHITPECIFRTKMPMKLDFIFTIADKVPESMKKALIDPPFIPQPSLHAFRGKCNGTGKEKRCSFILPLREYGAVSPADQRSFYRSGCYDDPDYHLPSGKKGETGGISVCGCGERERSDRSDRAAGQIRRAE